MEGHDRIGDELAGAVIRDLAAALDALHRDAPIGQLGRGRQDVGRVAVAPKGQHRRVLEQEQAVADRPVGTVRGELTLERVAVAVLDPAEPVGTEGGRCRVRGQDRRIHVGTIAGRTHPPVSRRRRAPWPRR